MGAAGRVPLVGLTGGLGAGKSEALRALGELGAATLSTDAVVHELLATDELRDLVVERLGSDVAPSGTLDRNLIAARVFADDTLRGWLEDLLWPRVGARVAAWYSEQQHAEPTPIAAVVETPLLFEAGMEDRYDCTIAVIADEGLRDRRAAARGHAAVAERAGRQLSQTEKAQRADYVVRNDGSLEELKQRLSSVLAKLRVA
jgi:dephospho-CoA kinase